MLTWVLGYLLIGVFIFWLAAAVFGVDPDVPLTWQIAAIALWPLVVITTGYRMATRQPIDVAAMESALHRHDASPIRRNADFAHGRKGRRSIVRGVR